jgi:hypothetical protein
MRKPFGSPPRLLILGLVALALSALCWTGCGTDTSLQPTTPGRTDLAVNLEMTNPQVQAVMAVQDRHTRQIMQDPNVVGTATGVNADGQLCVKIYLAKATQVPTPVDLDGVPVDVEITGKFVAMAGNKTKQTPPISLGTSGGWRYDLANGYCCGGTLGSLVKIGTTQYILSNYHVFRADIVSGGNSRVATNGDPIIQPGLIDVNCTASSAQNVGTLAGSASLPGSNVDCAIAQVISGMVQTDGRILGIGTLSATTVAASVNQKVKKAGRTTGLTRSTVSALNGTVSISYENECAGGTAFTKTFTGQIMVTNRSSKFLAGGDSGSLMVQDVTTSPKAIGLLFAGSTSIAVANPINSVLSFLGATMVGN